MHLWLEIFGYYPIVGQVVRQELVSMLKYKEPLHETHDVEDPPEQVVQVESQSVQIGEGVSTLYWLDKQVERH